MRRKELKRVSHAKGPRSGAFLQSEQWEKFQRTAGNKTQRVAGALLIYHELAFGLRYAIVSRPETFDQSVCKAVKSTARKNKCVFVRVEPYEELTGKMYKVRDYQPSTTRIVDLSASESELLAAMKSKTRYNIRLAAKKGVEVKKALGEWGVKRFLKLVKKTGERHGFGLHKTSYYKTMVSTLKTKELSAHLFVARINKKTRAVALVLKHGEVATYLHGGSSEKDKGVMAPYALHWNIMRWAKKNGCHYYDFWGEAPAGQSGHPLEGVTRFKSGFGGEVFTYPGAYEIPLRRGLYLLLRAYRSIKMA